MNHADRQRLSLLLAEIDNDIDALGHGYTPLQANIDAARAIVDNPEPAGYLTISGKNITITDSSQIAEAVKTALADQAPSPKLDAFLTEPMHEYGVRINNGNHRRRHRAHSPLRTALTLTIAAIALTALTASPTPPPRPDGPDEAVRPAEARSGAAQTWFRPGTAPYIPGHGPGTYGHGLGANTPSAPT